jgi:invasion protein IalB
MRDTLKMTLLVASSGALLFAAAPALAQTQAANQPAPASKKDPNRIICERVEEIGSRLASKKICMTAQQWEEKRRSDRESLEDAQQRSIEPNSG